METKNDHRVLITESADNHTQWAREAVDDETEHEYFLDIEVFRSDSNPDRYRVEFLLTCGGPTVRVIVNEFGPMFHHSWGMDQLGKDRHDCDFNSDDRDFWESLAERYGEQ